MLELQFVHIYRDFGVPEELKASGVVQMKMTHDDGFDIADLVARLLDLVTEFMRLIVVHTGEDVVEWHSPNYSLGSCEYLHATVSSTQTG